MRHFLFIVPPLAVLAGIGIHACLSVLETQGRSVGLAASLGVAAAFAWNATTLIRLHPYEYLFYNSLVGGLEGASRRYATDYWVNIMPVAVKDLEHYLDRSDARGNPRALRHSVGVCGERVSFEHEADHRLRWSPDWDHADFFIAPTHHELRSGSERQDRERDQIRWGSDWGREGSAWRQCAGALDSGRSRA